MENMHTKKKTGHWLKISVFWCVTPCRLASTSRRFEGSQSLHVQGLGAWRLSASEHKGTAAAPNVRSYTQACHLLEDSDLQRHILHTRHGVTWIGTNQMKTTARTGSKGTSEGTEGSAVSVQVVSVLIDIASPCALRNMASLLLRKICDILWGNIGNCCYHTRGINSVCWEWLIAGV
jgi:hypothetical protein